MEFIQDYYALVCTSIIVYVRSNPFFYAIKIVYKKNCSRFIHIQMYMFLIFLDNISDFLSRLVLSKQTSATQTLSPLQMNYTERMKLPEILTWMDIAKHCEEILILSNSLNQRLTLKFKLV